MAPGSAGLATAAWPASAASWGSASAVSPQDCLLSPEVLEPLALARLCSFSKGGRSCQAVAGRERQAMPIFRPWWLMHFSAAAPFHCPTSSRCQLSCLFRRSSSSGTPQVHCARVSLSAMGERHQRSKPSGLPRLAWWGSQHESLVAIAVLAGNLRGCALRSACLGGPMHPDWRPERSITPATLVKPSSEL